MANHDHLTDIDLICLVDRELTAAERAAALAHLDGCDNCRARHDEVARAVPDAIAAVQAGSRQPSAAHARARAVLTARLAQSATVTDPGWAARARTFSLSVARWSTAAAAVLAVIMVSRAVRSHLQTQPGGVSAAVERDALPIAALTPGATADITVDQICRGAVPRPAPADPLVRSRVLAEYGMAQVPAHEYELDYLITPELGGATDPQNLWPERYGNRTWNAKVKDQLEDLLPALVCQGKVDLRTAQQDIAADWVAAYKKYFKTEVPLRPGV